MKVFAQNSKAKNSYEFLEYFEAGIVLTGPETKSIRNGGVSIIDAFAVIENEEAFEEAFTNCEDILRRALPEQFDLDPEVEAALIDASLEFSQCMREEGIDFPDPTPGEFGFFAFRDADVDWSSDEVQKAFEVCQPENPLENLDD